MNENKEQLLEEIDLKIKTELEKFNGLPVDVDKINSVLDEKMFSNIDVLLKEIKNISFVSVTAAPFSLTILSSQLNINNNLLILSFVIFMFNVLVLNIGVWYVNNELLKSTSSQKLEGLTMGINVADINDVNLETTRRSDALFNFFKSKNSLETKTKADPYKNVIIVDKIRFLGTILLSSAIVLLIGSIALPLFIKALSFLCL